MTLADIIEESGVAIPPANTSNKDPEKIRLVEVISKGIQSIIKKEGAFFVYYEVLEAQRKIRLPDGNPLPEFYIRNNTWIQKALRERGALRTFEQTLKQAYSCFLNTDVHITPELARRALIWRQSETGLKRFLKRMNGNQSKSGRVIAIQLAQPYRDTLLAASTNGDGRVRHAYERRT